jgi:hypothetical protein
VIKGAVEKTIDGATYLATALPASVANGINGFLKRANRMG